MPITFLKWWQDGFCRSGGGSFERCHSLVVGKGRIAVGPLKETAHLPWLREQAAQGTPVTMLLVVLDTKSQYWYSASQLIAGIRCLSTTSVRVEPVHNMMIDGIQDLFVDIRDILEHGGTVAASCWQSRHRSIATLVLWLMVSS